MKTYPTLVECGHCHKQDTINIPLIGYATKEDAKGWSQLMPCMGSTTLCPECGEKWDNYINGKFSKIPPLVKPSLHPVKKQTKTAPKVKAGPLSVKPTALQSPSEICRETKHGLHPVKTLHKAKSGPQSVNFPPSYEMG
jgi:hypothetical protein